MIRLAIALVALAELGLARLLPEVGPGLYLRLGAATIVLFLPGALIAEALGRRSASLTLAWSLAACFGALAVTFATGGSLATTLVLLLVVALAAAPLALGARSLPRLRGSFAVGTLGVLFGIALWHTAGPLDGDALFHLARVRKLAELDSLSLDGVGEFADGGLHPGYAFPLWHGFLALVAELAGVDSAEVVRHQPSLLAPIAFLVTYEAGAALFRSAAGGIAVLLGQVALVGFAAGHGGSYPALALPGTAARQLLVPAVLALVFTTLAAPTRTLLVSVAAGMLALALVHPTYAVFLGIPLAGFFIVRAAVERAEIRRIATISAALALPTVAVVAWLAPILAETLSRYPDGEERRRALGQYAGQLEIFSEESYRLAPEVLSRSGAVAVAALVLVPLAALALRRRFAAFVLGGSLAVLVTMLAPQLFTVLADEASLSQARRAAGFLPFAFALAGGAAVLAGTIGVLCLPLALGAGIAAQIVFPGDFGPTLEDGGPALVTWVAALGGAAALAGPALARSLGTLERRGALMALASFLFVAPVAVHGIREWGVPERSPSLLTPGLTAALRAQVEAREIVFSDLETSYRLAAVAPVYVAAAPPAHVANTRANRPYERREEVVRFFRRADLRIPRRYGAHWIVVDRRRYGVALPLETTYRDRRYVLYRISAAGAG